MNVFSFHLTECGIAATLRALARPPKSRSTAGLVHAECLVPMTLGRPVALPWRYRPHQLAMFAAWQSEDSIDDFLRSSGLGRALAPGWHVRMEFVRRWGHISELDGLPLVARELADHQPVVAVTLARLRVSQARRFIRWGRPVEEQVRDDPATTFSLAAMRPVGTLSTFSIWKTQKAMTDMVHGRSAAPAAQRHASAMQERNRKDFHHEFTTLRFRPLSEHGCWQGRDRLLPEDATISKTDREQLYSVVMRPARRAGRRERPISSNNGSVITQRRGSGQTARSDAQSSSGVPSQSAPSGSERRCAIAGGRSAGRVDCASGSLLRQIDPSHRPQE